MLHAVIFFSALVSSIALSSNGYVRVAGVATNSRGQIFVYTRTGHPYAVERDRELRVGGVIHNDVAAFRADQMPYGGSKDSGFGREGLRYAMEEMTEPRVLVTRG